MSALLGITTAKESKLWTLLNANSDTSTNALKENVLTLCDEASQRMKMAIRYFPEYTLHDDAHLLRVAEIIPMILGDTLEQLNPVELALLLLGSFFHDIGMVPTEPEYETLMKSSHYALFRERWIVNHPNYAEIQKQLQTSKLTQSGIAANRKYLDELDQALLTDYLRQTHAFASGEYVRNLYSSDKRIEIYGINLSDYVAKVCMAHGVDIGEVTPENGYNYDEKIGKFAVNLSFVSILIRLADILDFDRERTPDSLYQSIHFTSKISISEWEKHRSVQGWSIEKNLLRFTMYFEHPVYEKVARKFLDAIDSELVSCHIVCNNYPFNFSRYKLNIPQRVDRTRVGPRGNSYLFFDLEFSLSRNEIVNLLLTHNLYNSPSLCVRELLQNSVDALRTRRAQFKESDITWPDGKVVFEHYIEEDGTEVLKCQDNGIGMDENIIRNHFTRVGRSYYRSPEFDQRRVALKKANADFDPCSQFGIGFMSCFMIGDRIVIHTRKDYGQGKAYGDPLIIEINGTGGIILIRKGDSAQPIGTTVYIYGRQKPEFFDIWTDQIRLTTVLKGYALAIEFPVYGKCSIPEIVDECRIDGQVSLYPTFLESKKLRSIKALQREFNRYDAQLGGSIRECFLVDDTGNLCIENNEAKWVPITAKTNRKYFALKLADGTELEGTRGGNVTVCLDGVLVAGNPGRPGYSRKVTHLLGWRNSGIYSHAPCCIDVRGYLKPEITPARVPVEHHGMDMTPKWNKIRDIVANGEGDLWSDAVATFGAKDPSVFWKLGIAYHVDYFELKHEVIYNTVPFPFLKGAGETVWMKPQELGELCVYSKQKSLCLKEKRSNNELLITEELRQWEATGTSQPMLAWTMPHLLASICSMTKRDNEILLSVTNSSSPGNRPLDSVFRRAIGGGVFLKDYTGSLSQYLSIGAPFDSVNRAHPMVGILQEGKYLSSKNIIQQFAYSFLLGISGSLNGPGDDLVCVDRWKKFIGSKYASVDWSAYDSLLGPPYLVKLANGRDIEINQSTFEAWREIALEPEAFLEQSDDEPIDL
jgi:Histidine kinase-, DNA gyrase B-, and HSP90-like ATPase